jgi:hypothetical protein
MFDSLRVPQKAVPNEGGKYAVARRITLINNNTKMIV